MGRILEGKGKGTINQGCYEVGFRRCSLVRVFTQMKTEEGEAGESWDNPKPCFR